MAMLHAGAPADSFIVDAVDVSRRPLESARAGRVPCAIVPRGVLWYPRALLRSTLKATARGICSAPVASLVRFSARESTAIPIFWKMMQPYDVVFCRNLLIYLHAEARLLAIDGFQSSGSGTMAFSCWARRGGFRTGTRIQPDWTRGERLRSASLSRGACAEVHVAASRQKRPSGLVPAAVAFGRRKRVAEGSETAAHRLTRFPLRSPSSRR